MKLTKNIAKITAAVAGAVALATFATATTANADSVYTVQSGDTLSSISYKLGHDLTYVDSLASTNQIANKNLIYVGQKLVIKDDGEVTKQLLNKLLLYRKHLKFQHQLVLKVNNLAKLRWLLVRLL